jgi:hypothetical protein
MKYIVASRGLPLVLVALIVALAAGGGYALASGSSKTITLCVKKHGGAVYKAKKCKKGDSKLSFNKQGPRGATGATGTTGATGATGPAGPSASYSATESPGSVPSDGTSAAALSLPAGHYTVSASAILSNTSTTTPADVVCEVTEGTTAITEGAASLEAETSASTGSAYVETVASTGSVNLTAPGSLALSCESAIGATAGVYNGSLTATSVGSLNRSSAARTHVATASLFGRH